MPESTSIIVQQALTRARDQQGTFGGDNRTVALDLLNRLQQLYNNQLLLVSSDVSLTITPMLILYPFLNFMPRMLTITGVNENGRTLDRLTFGDLRAIDSHWIRATGPRLEGYMQLGFSHVLVWPAVTDTRTVVVSGIELTADITLDPGADLQVSTQQTPRLLQLLELCVLHRQRDMLAFDALYQQFEGGRRGTQTQAQTPAVVA